MLIPLFVAICLIMTFGFLLEYRVILPENIRFEIILPCLIVLPLIPTIIIGRKSFSKENVVLSSDYIQSSRIGKLNYREVSVYRRKVFRGGVNYVIKLKSGTKIAVSPSSSFKSRSYIDFEEFIKDFEKRIKTVKNSNLS
jgi:hypothetical protein